MQDRQLLDTFHDQVRPAHTAVLVVDMQNDYVAPGGATDKRNGNVAAGQAIIPPLRRLIDGARRYGALVVYIKMTLDADLRLVSDVEYTRRRRRWGDIPVAVEGTWGHDVVAELAPLPGEWCVAKTRSSGFVGTNLDMVLRSHYIRTALVTGVVTQGCVASTARDAVHHDYYTILVGDCVASGSQRMHELALADLEQHGQRRGQARRLGQRRNPGRPVEAQG
jgi:nicotinamidase-related amidase